MRPRNLLPLAPWAVLATLLLGWAFGSEGRIDLTGRFLAPGLGHLFGTDELGRDLLGRFWLGGARSVTLGLLMTAFHVTLGLALALAAHGRLAGRALLLGAADLLASIPSTLLALLLLAFLRPGLQSLLLALALGGWIPYARIALTQLDALREDPSLAQEQLLGANATHRLRYHLLPRLWPVLGAQASVGLGAVILVEGGLSFLGVGLPPDRASWGTMLASARAFFLVSPWPLIWPSLGLLAVLLSLRKNAQPG
jgi:peptide/nickel transport system permease protein